MNNQNKIKWDWDLITEWRDSEGLSYRELINKCIAEWGKAPSKSSFSYQFGKTTKKKAQARQKSYREGFRGRISHKLNEFKKKKKKSYVWEGNKNSNNPRESIRVKLKSYKDKKMSKELTSPVTQIALSPVSSAHLFKKLTRSLTTSTLCPLAA